MSTITNAEIPKGVLKKSAEISDGKDPLFAVVGDLSMGGSYGTSSVLVYENFLIAFDDSHENGYIKIDFSSVKKVYVKRLYGNALFRVKDKNDKYINLIRFTYAQADIGDAVCGFINEVNKNGFDPELIEAVHAVYNKMRCFCPKCGRKLPSPDAECVCKKKGSFFSFMLRYAKPVKWSLVGCMLMSVFTTLLALVPPYVTKIMVDDIIPNQKKKMLLITISALLGIYIIQYCVTAFNAYRLRITSDKIITGLRKDIFAKAQYLPVSFYDKTSTGSVINRVNSDTAVLQTFITRISQEAVAQFFMLIGLVGVMLSLNWKLTVLSLIPIPIVVAASKFYGKIIAPRYRRMWRRNEAFSSALTDSIPGIRIIKAFTNENSTVDKFSTRCDDWLKEDKKVARTSSVFPSVITFLVTCGSVIIWGVGGNMVISNSSGITLGLLVSFISYASMFYNPVNFFANLNDSYQNAVTSTEKILDIIDAEPEPDFGRGHTLDKISGKIEFKNVNFSFDRSQKVLDDVNLVIEPGDVVGIVGTTGSGKSTLINLIMRYYDDYEGEVLIDGVNIKDIDLKYYRSQIGLVQQEPLMFRDTIYNNIAYGHPELSPEDVIYAADVANAHGFISQLPDSYDTVLGERGVGLSGGEKQRLSIARAVIKNPSILIFDEATAAVDSETEKQIQEAIDRLIQGRTTLMIAHRLSTLKKANKIIVVDNGRIIEFGTQEELLKKKGKYYRLVQIQSMSEDILKKKETEGIA